MATKDAAGFNNAPLTICPGCHSTFRTPLFLPCCHTVCLECVEVTNAGMSRCPKCQSETEREPTSLPRDVITERVVSVESVRRELEEKGSVLCSECEEEEDTKATHFCLVCTKPICELDFKLHKRMYKETHQIVSLEEVKLKSLEQLYPRHISFQCSFHPDTIANEFCKQCHMFLCSYCLSHHHQDHQISNGEEVGKRVSELSEQNREEFERLGNEDYSAAQNFLEKVARMRADLEVQFDDMKRVLDERKGEVIGKLDVLYKDTLRVIQRGERWREHVRDLIEKSRAYAHFPMDGDLVTNLDCLNCKVVELLRGPPARTKYRDIEFLMDQDVKCLLKALGCFRLKYTQDIMPDHVIETHTAHSKHKFTPFAITKGDNNLLYNFTDSCQVVVMDRMGGIVNTFQPSHLKNTLINSGYIHWNKGLLYIVAGEKQSVTVCTEAGDFVKVFGSEGKRNGQLNTPLSIAVSNLNGDIYVLEEGNNRVQVFNAQYKFRTFIGYFIDTPGQIKNPVELALTPKDEVVVVQRNNPSINIYSSDGALLKQFGTSSLGGFVCAIGAMCIAHTGQLVLSDTLQNQVIVYDSDNNTMWTVGSEGNERGQYRCPCGVVCLEDGTVYVCDMGAEKIQVYKNKSFILGYN